MYIAGSSFYAVYDGHGGQRAAEFVAKTLHHKIIATDAFKVLFGFVFVFFFFFVVFFMGLNSILYRLAKLKRQLKMATLQPMTNCCVFVMLKIGR